MTLNSSEGNQGLRERRQRQGWVISFDEFHFPSPSSLAMMKHSSFGIATVLIKHVKSLAGCSLNP